MISQWILDSIKKIRWGLMFGMILWLMESLAEISLIYMQRIIIDNYMLGSNTMEHFRETILLFLGLILFYVFLHTLAPFYNGILQFSLYRILCQNFMRIVFKIPSGKFQEERISNYVNYVTRDTINVSAGIADYIPKIVGIIIKILAILGIVLSVHRIIFMLLCLVGLLYLASIYYFSNRTKQSARNVLDSKAEILLFMEENISATRESISYNRIGYEKRKFEELFKRYYSFIQKEGAVFNKQVMFSEPLLWGSKLIVIAYCGYLIMNSKLSLGAFVIIYQLSTLLLNSLNDLFQRILSTYATVASLDRLNIVMRENGNLTAGGHHIIEGAITDFKFNNISFSYDDNNQEFLLNNLSLQLPLGQKIAFVGSSGSGKSTLLQLLAGLYKPSSGTLSVNDVSITEIEEEEWARRVSFVQQDPFVFPTTIMDNITLGDPLISVEKVIQMCDSMQVFHFINEMPNKFETLVGERGVTLSGGQKQRLALARAIVREPEILILDEATSALDVDTERLVLSYLDETRAGKTTIYSAHRLSTIENSDHIFVIRNGNVAEKGTHQQLMFNKSYYYQMHKGYGGQN